MIPDLFVIGLSRETKGCLDRIYLCVEFLILLRAVAVNGAHLIFIPQLPFDAVRASLDRVHPGGFGVCQIISALRISCMGFRQLIYSIRRRTVYIQEVLHVNVAELLINAAGKGGRIFNARKPRKVFHVKSSSACRGRRHGKTQAKEKTDKNCANLFMVHT